MLSRKLEYEILAVHTTQSREMTAGAGQTVKQKKAFKKVLWCSHKKLLIYFSRVLYSWRKD